VSLLRAGEPTVCEALPELFAMEDEGASLAYMELSFARRPIQDGELRLREKEAPAAKLTQHLVKWQERVGELKG
jgi:hypothetical protein